MTRRSMESLFLRALFIGSAIIVLVFSLMPTQMLPGVALDLWDKAQHLLVFLYLTILGCMAYRSPFRLLLALIIFGGLIEILQRLSGWRFGDWLDLLADLLGVLLGLAIYRAYR